MLKNLAVFPTANVSKLHLIRQRERHEVFTQCPSLSFPCVLFRTNEATLEA
jgi:hypothetical protein